MASRPINISANPLRTIKAGPGGTRHLSLLAASTSLRQATRTALREQTARPPVTSNVYTTARSFSLWRRNKPFQPERPTASPASLLALTQRSVPPQPITIFNPPHRHASSNPEPSPKSKPSTLLTQPLNTLSALTPHENIYTLPNILTFTRLLSVPFVGYLLLSPAYPPSYALALFTYAGLTDLLDGYLARRLNQHTVVGSVIDPMADKSLMAISTFCLAYTGILPWWTATIILGRDVALAISAIWWRWISLPPPKTMGRYWDFSLPSAEVYPTEISKINTLLQLLLIGNAMVLPVLPEAIVEAGNLWGVFEGWCGLVAGTTVWSGLSYVGNKDAVKIVSQEEVRRVLEERERKASQEKGGEVERK